MRTKKQVRIKLSQRPWDKLKKKMETIVEKWGGTYTDEQVSGGRIKSRYSLHSNKRQFVWHNSYGDARAIKNARATLRDILRILGIGNENVYELQMIDRVIIPPPNAEKLLQEFDDALDEVLSGPD